MKPRIGTLLILSYFLLSVCFPFFMMLEGNYYLRLNFNGIIITNFIFIIIGLFLLKPNWHIENFEKGLLALTMLVFINLLVHGIYKEEWLNFSYLLSITLILIIFKNIEFSKSVLRLDLYVPLIFSLLVLIHLLLAFRHGYGKLGFTNDCFINPGHFSGFVIIFCPLFLSISYFKKANTKLGSIVKIICSITCALAFFIVVFNNTRTGWIGAIIISNIYHLIWQLRKNPDGRISLPTKINGILQMGFIVFLFGFAAYLSKRESAEGRLLIWRLSATIIKDNPLTGVGFNRFEAVYNLYQSDYFKTHNDPKSAWLADNVLVAYNDFLHFTVELGLFFLLPIFYLLAEIVKKFSWILKTDLKDISIKNASFIGLATIVFLQMFFSYPLSIIEITNAIFLNFLYVTMTDE